ncbi:MAG: hypothetical protein JNJ54_16290 [Myxococcaceae bacterium]|nr:hypothetical protein [Myxococcaceae bacterium]
MPIRSKTKLKANARRRTPKPLPSKRQAPAPRKPAGNVTFSRDGGLVIINAPAQYRSMARFFARPKDAPDEHDAIHLFVDDAVELEKLLPLAQSYQGAKTRFYVVFRHKDRVSDSREAITNAVISHGYRRTSTFSMGDSDWAACGFWPSPKV